jgi:hypothetical protein
MKRHRDAAPAEAHLAQDGNYYDEVNFHAAFGIAKGEASIRRREAHEGSKFVPSPCPCRVLLVVREDVSIVAAAPGASASADAQAINAALIHCAGHLA